MPDWITAVLNVASWPARQIAVRNDYDQTGWVYLAGVFVLYVVEAVFIAFGWFHFWLWMAGAVRSIGEWAARTGSIQSMKSVERVTSEFARVCGWLQRLAGFSFSSDRLPRRERVPGDDASRPTRVARFFTRATLNALSGLVEFVKQCVGFLVRPLGLLFLVAAVATVYPNAFPDAIAWVGRRVSEVQWSTQLITSIVTMVGVLVAVGVVAVKGFLSDKVSARRHVQDARNRRALEAIVPLAEPMVAIAHYGMVELEGVCAQVKWQLNNADRWINRNLTKRDIAWRNDEHLACDADCPDRYEHNTESSSVIQSFELAAAFEKLDQIYGEENPLYTWRRELRRLCSYRERTALRRLCDKEESLSEQIKAGLFLLEKDEFRKIRIRWQHRCPTILLDDDTDEPADYIAAERKRMLDELAADYRRRMWITLERLRHYEELADIAWRANGPNAARLAKVSK